MVIVIKTGTPEAAIRQLLAQLAAQNVKGGCVAGPNGILLPLVGDTWRLDPNMLQGLPYVQEVRRLTPPIVWWAAPHTPPIPWLPWAMQKSVKNSA